MVSRGEVHRVTRCLVVVTILVALFVAGPGLVFAHEGRMVHGYEFDVGFLQEPAYEGQPNAVFVSVVRTSGHGHSVKSVDSHVASSGHAELFTSTPIDPGEQYELPISDDFRGLTIPWHSHLNPKLSGTLQIRSDGAVGHVEVALHPDHAMPSDIHVAPGATVIWKNASGVLQTVTSGQHDAASSEEHAHEGDADSHAAGGVEGLADTVTVEVVHLGSGSRTQMNIHPMKGDPGSYIAPFIPTAPGQYQFRFVGAVGSVDLDESFTSGPGTFDDVQSTAAVQFPVVVPSAREVAGVVEASQQEVRSVADVSASAQVIAIAALVVSVIGLAGGCMAVIVMVRERRA